MTIVAGNSGYSGYRREDNPGPSCGSWLMAGWSVIIDTNSFGRSANYIWLGRRPLFRSVRSRSPLVPGRRNFCWFYERTNKQGALFSCSRPRFARPRTPFTHRGFRETDFPAFASFQTSVRPFPFDSIDHSIPSFDSMNSVWRGVWARMYRLWRKCSGLVSRGLFSMSCFIVESLANFLGSIVVSVGKIGVSKSILKLVLNWFFFTESLLTGPWF